MSIAEVAFAKAEKDGKVLDPAVEAEIDTLWHPDSPVRLVEVSQLICIGARRLLRDAMIRAIPLRAADAVHLATAVMIGETNQFHTYDEKLRKCQPLVPFNISEPTTAQLLLPMPSAATPPAITAPSPPSPPAVSSPPPPQSPPSTSQ